MRKPSIGKETKFLNLKGRSIFPFCNGAANTFGENLPFAWLIPAFGLISRAQAPWFYQRGGSELRQQLGSSHRQRVAQRPFSCAQNLGSSLSEWLPLIWLGKGRILHPLPVKASLQGATSQPDKTYCKDRVIKKSQDEGFMCPKCWVLLALWFSHQVSAFVPDLSAPSLHSLHWRFP